MASDAPALDAAAIAATFNRHRVRYVVIGAFAAIAQGAPIAATRDIDFTPDGSNDNLARLSAAITELDAHIRVASTDEGLPFAHDAASLARASIWNLICRYGEFDIAFRPSGFAGGYPELATHARRLIVDGTEVSVAALDDVIHSKEAAGRPKDLQVLPSLYRYLASKRPPVGS